MAKVLLYLHGFHSSPSSLKTQQTKSYIADCHPEIKLITPQLPCLPKDMWQVICDVFTKHENDDIAVIGSSLGGFLCTKIVEQYAVNAVLINPAVGAFHLLEEYAGEHVHPYLNERYTIDQNYLAQLTQLLSGDVEHADKIWVLLQKGDEVLDYQQAMKKYQDCKITCEEGGDHSFIGFDRHLSDIIPFLFSR